MTGTIELLRDGEQVFPVWLEAIASAKYEILLEMYWFGSDRTGRRFAELLCEKARAGLDVFVLYDAVGSFGADPGMFGELAKAGAKVIEFHPIAPWRKRFRLDRITVRDHRKILVVDGEVGFTGGINICDQQAPRAEGGAGWRDDAVRITGPAVLELRALFFDNWLRLDGPRPRRGAAIVRRGWSALVAAAREQVGAPAPVMWAWPERISRITRTSFTGPPAEGVSVPRAASVPSIQVLGHAAWGAQRTIRNMYVRHIRAARDKILIANSYFIPDNSVRRALEYAARRGVEVRVITPAHSDVPSVQHASRALYARLMRSGVHVHEWVDGMLHAKTALVDQWATVGSYNLDYRSLRYNLEVNVASADPAFVASVEKSLRMDLERCVEIDPVAWEQRPLLQRLLQWVHFLVRKFL